MYLVLLSDHCFLTDVQIGFSMAEILLNVTEDVDDTINVCTDILNGTLERNVSVIVSTTDLTAQGILDFILLIYLMCVW